MNPEQTKKIYGKPGRPKWVKKTTMLRLGADDEQRLKELYEASNERASANDVILQAIKELHARTFISTIN